MRQTSGMEWSMVWRSRVGDNLDTATTTVAAAGSAFCLPSRPSACASHVGLHFYL